VQEICLVNRTLHVQTLTLRWSKPTGKSRGGIQDRHSTFLNVNAKLDEMKLSFFP